MKDINEWGIADRENLKSDFNRKSQSNDKVKDTKIKKAGFGTK